MLPPLVVKIGGSLTASGRAAEVLALVARSPRRVVIVPGGGAYADAVRAEQHSVGFDDRRAHHLAILAMHQMAADFQALQPTLVAVHSIGDLRKSWAGGCQAIWLPWPMVEHEPSIAQDWSMTSDGLAAWLATQIDWPPGGAEVALIKACAVPPASTLEGLADTGMTDRQFPTIVSRASLTWHVLDAGDTARLSALLKIEPRGP